MIVLDTRVAVRVDRTHSGRRSWRGARGPRGRGAGRCDHSPHGAARRAELPSTASMRTWLGVFTGLVLLASGSSGCGGGASPGANNSFPARTLFELASDSGQQHVEVRTAPEQPPTRGIVEMQLTITDATTGTPANGLELSVVPWMPAMGHGASVTPTVVETAPGIYDLENLVLFMPGTWQIRTKWDGTAVDNVTPTLEVR